MKIANLILYFACWYISMFEKNLKKQSYNNIEEKTSFQFEFKVIFDNKNVMKHF